MLLVQRIPRTTRNITFQDTLKVKDGRFVLAFYPVRLDTDIKLAVSWDLIDEGLLASTPRRKNVNDMFAWHSADRVPASWRGISHSLPW